MAQIVVIGCGNPNRQDDGVGPQVIALLRARALGPGVQLYDAGTDGMGVLYLARGASHMILVDARVASAEPCPGAIYEVPGEALQLAPPASYSLHDFRWDHALYAGRRIQGAEFPPVVTVLLIEAATLGFGLGLSPPVAAAAARVADRIGEIVATWMGQAA